MKTFKCKQCEFTASGNGPSVLIAHAREVHGRSNRGARGGRRRRSATAALAAAVVEIDRETNLITQCTRLFSEANLDRWGDQRVLEYLAQRFGPAAYDGVTEDVVRADDEPEE